MKKLRRIIRISCVTLLVGSGLLWLSLAVLPGLVESWMLPQLVRQLGYDNFACRIDHFGLTETSAGPLQLGSNPKPALTIERIRLLYNPKSLANGELKQVILSGLNIRAVLNNGKISFPGLGKKLSSDSKKEPTENSQKQSRLQPPPFTLLTIENSLLTIRTNSKEFYIPFSGSLKKSANPTVATARLDGNLLLNPRGTSVSLKVSISLNEKEPAHLKLIAEKIELSDFADLLNKIDNLSVKGQVVLKTEADLNFRPLSLEKLQARIEWRRGKLDFNDLHIDNSDPATDDKSSTILTISKDEVSAPWRLKLDQLTFLAPFSPTIANFEMTIDDEADKINLQGHWTTQLQSRDRASGLNSAGLSLDEIFTKEWRLTAAINRRGGYQASLSSPAGKHKWRLHNDSLSISGNSPAINIEILNQNSDSEQINPGRITWNISLNQLSIKSGENHLILPEIKTDGQTKLYASGKKSDDLPVSGTSGSLMCRKIILNQTNLGPFNASLKQQGKIFQYEGRYDCKPVKKLKLLLTGECGFKPEGGFQTKANLTFPAYKPDQPIKLGKLIPAAGKSTLDGIFAATGKFAYNNDDNRNQIRSELTINIDRARYNDPDKNISCNGINCSLKFPNLITLSSEPNQKFSFARLRAGNISCQNGIFSFRIERDQSLFIEKGRIGWCGGNVETQALRISPDIDHYQSTLYCDRLKLTELLQQLGQIEAQGQGSVNGRIPITLSHGKISFNDGFLYSTPNQPGNIKIRNATALTAGIPANSPQFAQLDLAREALKDYQYKWAKLKLNSADDELTLNLQFDGKPNLALPFIYKKELGGFVRITGSGPGSHFQGIRLDINLRLPLNHILQYKDFSDITN